MQTITTVGLDIAKSVFQGGIECTACGMALFTTAIKATGAARIRLCVDQRPGAVLRLDALDDDGVVAIVAPVYWNKARAEAA
jgi:hypothetical protein